MWKAKIKFVKNDLHKCPYVDYDNDGEIYCNCKKENEHICNYKITYVGRKGIGISLINKILSYIKENYRDYNEDNNQQEKDLVKLISQVNREEFNKTEYFLELEYDQVKNLSQFNDNNFLIVKTNFLLHEYIYTEVGIEGKVRWKDSAKNMLIYKIKKIPVSLKFDNKKLFEDWKKAGCPLVWNIENN